MSFTEAVGLAEAMQLKRAMDGEISMDLETAVDSKVVAIAASKAQPAESDQPPREEPLPDVPCIPLEDRCLEMGLTSYPLHVVFPSLAQLLTRRVHGCNKDRHLVQGDIVGWIEKLLYSSDPRVRRWRGVVANLSRSVSQFHKLPLFLAHPSISATTALVNDNCEVTALLGDDEGNTCVEIQREFFSAEHLFWDSLFRSMDPFSRAEALRHIDLVQDAVRLATLLEHFPIDSEGNPQPTFDFMMQYLPFFLSYRIPLGRGTSEDAFDDALEERVENWLIYRCRDGREVE